MDGFDRAAACLPAALKNAVFRLPASLTARVQEIRLRAGTPLMLSAPDGEWMVTQAGEAVKTGRGDLLTCSSGVIEECFLILCEYSVHTHQQELRSGFITAPNGCRAGIAGTAVTENGSILSVRSITSICLRVARRHDGCAGALLLALTDGDGLHSALICGEPSSGKSSLLKDLARQLSSGTAGRFYRTAVVDERGELSGDGGLAQCDVLRGYPKALGIGQAVRCLAPEAVLFDEMGTSDEVQAVLEGLNSGVAAVTTAHCRDRETLLRRPQLKAALESGAFEKVVFLEGRRYPGKIARVAEVRDLLDQNCRTAFDCIDRDRRGAVCVGRFEPARSLL